jgi:predicted kinase
MSQHKQNRPPSPPEAHPTMYVMVGLPAAGKTTLARRIEIEHQALRLTPDEWMIPLFGESTADGKRNVLEGRFIATALCVLRLGRNVVLDFGVWAKEERTSLRWLASSVGAECELVYLAIGQVEQQERIDQRFATAPHSTFPITPSDLDEYRTIFQPPGEEELCGNELDPPPPGFESWRSWIAAWWPTSLD